MHFQPQIPSLVDKRETASFVIEDEEAGILFRAATNQYLRLRIAVYVPKRNCFQVGMMNKSRFSFTCRLSKLTKFCSHPD